MFTHEIKLVHSNGEATLASRKFGKAFCWPAFIWFNLEATKHFPCLRVVEDKTLANYHFSTLDGSVVLELR